MTCTNTATECSATTDYHQDTGDDEPCQNEETPPPPPPSIPANRVFLAPMVRGSELAFRQLVRRYGVQVCYSPMLRAERVVAAYNNGDVTCNDNMHEDAWLLRHDIMADTEPLVVQLCGNSPTVLAQATRVLLDLHYTGTCQIEGIDLNLGCPQTCAKRGHFGAFLAQHNPKLALECVAAMRHTIDNYAVTNGKDTTKIRPRLSCKFRLQQDLDATIQFARDLVQAGCQLLAVHCRQMTDKHDGEPNLQAATRIVQAVAPVPVVINGWSWATCAIALQRTKAYGVMVARDFLRNPRLLSSVSNVNGTTDPGLLAAEYLELCEIHPPPSELYYKLHFRWLFRAALEPDASQKYNPATYAQDWRPRFWNFLARPYLTCHAQFQQVVVLYWQYRWNDDQNNDNEHDDKQQQELPASLQRYLKRTINEKDSNGAETNQQLSSAITFHSIRYYNNN